ncbi:MAG: nucleotide sugar dehydrogenase, partial [Pseudobdellovibrio sp.]
MKLIVVGAGNIGLITALCFANKGHRVYCTDIDQKKIDQLQKSESYLYEPELASLLKKSVSEGNISFSHKLSEVISETKIIFIAVGTPNLADGSIDLKAFEGCIQEINDKASDPKTVIIKSTVAPNTNKKLSALYPKHNFISSPEFLREGSAIYDCLHPDRIIIGSDFQQDLELFKNIYKEFNLTENVFIQMNSVTAEMTKYASNIFLAARISLINEFSRMCEKTGADIEMLKQGLSRDHR